MVYKDDPDDDDDDDSSLPPLLKRLPKDFDAAHDYDDDSTGAGDFGTMIVKTSRGRLSPSLLSPSIMSPAKPRGSSYLERSTGKRTEDEDNFSTFVVRSTLGTRDSGTVVRRGSGSVSASSTMSRAVASMQASGELGFEKHRRGSGSSQGDEARFQASKISTSSIPESMTREDPSTKYELLNELGEIAIVFFQNLALCLSL